MFSRILRHQHGSKHLIYTRVLTALTAAAVFTMPASALAFSVPAVSSASVPSLFAQVKSLQTDLSPEETSTPDASYTHTSASVVGMASPVAEESIWQKPSIRETTKTPAVKPTLENPVVLEGQASYYSLAGCLGCNPLRIMANGERLDDNALTMAIGADKKHLVGYRAKVTNLVTGQSVTVRITDTGGFYQEKYGRRVADLSVATKQAIGMKGGLGQVRVEIF